MSVSSSLELELSSIWLSSCQNSGSEHSDIEQFLYRHHLSDSVSPMSSASSPTGTCCPAFPPISGASASPGVSLGSTQNQCNTSTYQCKPPLPSTTMNGNICHIIISTCQAQGLHKHHQLQGSLRLIIRLHQPA